MSKNISDYEKPNVTSDLVLLRVREFDSQNARKDVTRELQVLLVERKHEPQQGIWSLPGGFVNIDEDIANNVKRKLQEKASITGDFYMEQLYTWDGINRDERGRVISVSYLGLCNEETYKEDYGDVVTGWFNVFSVLNGEQGELAFDHKKIIAYALERLQNKIEYTDIAFNLLPQEFTIGECQSVYELILQRKILNFRRKVEEYVRPLNKLKKQEGKQFRPAELYEVRKNRNSKF